MNRFTANYGKYERRADLHTSSVEYWALLSELVKHKNFPRCKFCKKKNFAILVIFAIIVAIISLIPIAMIVIGNTTNF